MLPFSPLKLNTCVSIILASLLFLSLKESTRKNVFYLTSEALSERHQMPKDKTISTFYLTAREIKAVKEIFLVHVILQKKKKHQTFLQKLQPEN